MADAPLCRYCGKPIRKRTHSVYFGSQHRRSSDSLFTYREERPTSKAEAQRLLNQTIVSVRWARGEDYDAQQAGFDYITMVTTWDGESYEDPFFCNGEHAKRLGYAAARGGYAMPVYLDAGAEQRAKSRERE